MASDDDPLDGAAVGETRTDEHTVTLSTVTYTPSEWYGTDRDVEMSVADVEIVDADHPDDPECVKVTYEAELTQHLSHNWDYCKEPRTETEEQREQKRQWRKKWGRRVSLAIGTLIPIVVTVFVTDGIMSRVSGEGPFEEVAAPGLGEIIGIVGFLLLFALFALWAIQRLPAPGSRRRSL